MMQILLVNNKSSKKGQVHKFEIQPGLFTVAIPYTTFLFRSSFGLDIIKFIIFVSFYVVVVFQDLNVSSFYNKSSIF